MVEFSGKLPKASASTITIAALFITICAGSIMSNVSIYSSAFSAHTRLGEFIRRLNLGTEDDENLIIPVFKVTEAERIEWFMKKLPRLGFLEADTVAAERFHARILEFFGEGCRGKFYMTWFSPVKYFRRRDFWAMESLFKAHPDGCLLLISNTMDSMRGYRVLNPLIQRGYKVLPIFPNLPFLVENTPAETWLEMMKNGTKDPGVHFLMNLSNLIRLAVLYKYGGIYLDTDVVLLKDVTGLRNTVGAQSVDPKTRKWSRLNGAVMIFDKGHPVLLKFLQEFALTYNGNKWGHNGPYMVSRVVARLEVRPDHEINIVPPEAFYLVYWTRIERLFARPENGTERRWAEEVMGQLERLSYGIHLWNKKSGMLRVEEGSVISGLFYNHCIICGKSQLV
ncbi:hypothetical protein SAY87_000569 [Trapa incisa]|uniref:Alpha 1,4-glycosyltransferase domain-containing protein n=1 Tax=Trapa incisa TaxID=236973 RepID=A0AAN7JH84_9MYRT|nr:hypothetical protein SAY87_000569 [Trapa incisa]